MDATIVGVSAQSATPCNQISFCRVFVFKGKGSRFQTGDLRIEHQAAIYISSGVDAWRLVCR